ncbi:5-methylcytosine restriction system specificity protein McrC [Parapedobacter sp. DT-150]
MRAKDCTPFLDEDQEAVGEVAAFLLKQAGAAANRFSLAHKAERKTDEESPLIEFDYPTKRWCAGRFVGSMEFEYNKKRYELVIEPRFGSYSLFRMIGMVFNVRTLPAFTDIVKDQSPADFFRRFIAYLWVHRLADCNRYGVPTHRYEHTSVGTALKGKLLIRPTMFSLHRREELVCSQLERGTDPIVARIIWQAYRRLAKEYQFDNRLFPDSANDALQRFGMAGNLNQAITEPEYRGIKLRVIYQPWKSLIDLSWEILKNRTAHQQRISTPSGHALFFDMAEIWEAYLGRLMETEFAADGWVRTTNRFFSYADNFFNRELIPDIVLEKGDKALVFDAKYKRMDWIGKDVDRSDFFQLHTYIHYMQQNKQVIGSGLLYPVSAGLGIPAGAVSKSLYGLGKIPTRLFIDGVEFPSESAGSKPDELTAIYAKNERAFVARMKDHYETHEV